MPFTNIILHADKHHIPKDEMRKLLPEHIRQKIKLRDSTHRNQLRNSFTHTTTQNRHKGPLNKQEQFIDRCG